MKDRVLIIDALGFIYRGVIKFGKSDKAEETIDYTIVYNFFRNIRALIEQFEPSKCFLVMEGNPQFRKDLFPDYKKNRIYKEGSKKADQKLDVLRQADIIFQLASMLPITLIKADAYEADDTIYTLAADLKNEEVIIVSSDSDMIQVLQKLPGCDIKLFHPSKKEYIEAPTYVYLVWKSIAGDISDNIPGILSVDKASAIAQDPLALREFLSVEENKANFLLNKQLIELRIVPNQELLITERDTNFEGLFTEFDKLGFASLLKEDYRKRFIHTFATLIH